jgi:hypothetical protein
MKKQEPCSEKECTRCKKTKPIEEFRQRSFGFILNQCKECEGEMNKARRLAKIEAAKVEATSIITITTKSGMVIEASTKPITGGRKTTSPLTDKVLYFAPDVNRDKARVAFSTFANVVRTGISYQPIEN